MNFDLSLSIPALTVFLQGLLSFFSPCILPIIPLYMSYLSGGSTKTDENGFPIYNQKIIFINTLFFIVGVSFAFFLLGISFSTLGQFFTQNQMIFSRIGGILIIFFGLMQLGIFDKPFGGREFKLPITVDIIKMNPFTALLMGFTFSFAWTPCVGPALSTVLIMISSASSQATGMMLMGVYTLGFTLPFLVVGIFTTKCLELFRRHGRIVAYTVKIGAVIMILMGLMMFTGRMNGITSYLSSFGTTSSTEDTTEEDITEEDTEIDEDTSAADTAEETEDSSTTTVPAMDFELQDQYGNTHTLADYEGKVIFLNFWATWCYYCVEEMPDIQALYEAYGYNEEDVIILGVAMPNDENANTGEGSIASVTSFLEENGFTYPTLMDTTGSLATWYGISSYPTTFMIDTQGNVYGYVSGMLTYDIMESIIIQTLEASATDSEQTEESSDTISSIMDLDTDKVSLIALGNSDVPVGRYAVEILQALEIWDDIESKISYASNVKEVLSQVELGSVSCGIVYATDAATNDNVVIVETLDSSLLDTPVIYPAAALANSNHSDAANLFLAYLTSELATTTFEDNGFTFIADSLNIEDKDVEPCTLTIFAAASLLESVTLIADSFMAQYDGIEVIASFDSSGTLATQIEYGADVDIFISASDEEMSDLIDLNLINESTYIQLLENELVLIIGGDTN